MKWLKDLRRDLSIRNAERAVKRNTRALEKLALRADVYQTVRAMRDEALFTLIDATMAELDRRGGDECNLT